MSRNNRDLGWEADSWGSSSSGSFSNSSASFGSAAPAYRNQDSWSSDLQQLQANMQAIQQLVGELDLQLPRIGTIDDSDDFRSRVQAKINDTRLRIKQSDDLIKSLERLENSGATAADNSKRRNVLSKSKKDFKVLIDRFKVLGKMWMDKSKSRTSNLPQSSYQSQLGTEHYYQQPPSGFESQPLISQSNNAQLMQQVNRYESEIQFRQYMANERDQEAQDIERGVADLAEIFQDFKNAVDAQQDLVDSIENNVSQAVDHSRQGVAQLEAAKGHQESARSKLYCVGLIAIVILAILVALAALGVSIKFLF